MTTREQMIDQILKRARSRTPVGFATVDELNSFAGGSDRLALDARFEIERAGTRPYPQNPQSIVSWVYRGVDSGEGDMHRQYLEIPHDRTKRYCIGFLVELEVGGEVVFTMPFPACNRENTEHNAACWQWVWDRLESCSDRLLNDLLAALG